MPRKCRTNPTLFGFLTQFGLLRVAQVWRHSPTAITSSSVVVGRWISRSRQNLVSRFIRMSSWLVEPSALVNTLPGQSPEERQNDQVTWLPIMLSICDAGLEKVYGEA